jgi:hypothetical protein
LIGAGSLGTAFRRTPKSSRSNFGDIAVFVAAIRRLFTQ